MFDKEKLIEVYESVLVILLNARMNELKFYVNQGAFSHMTLSAAFWHYDLYWNLWEKEDTRFTRHDDVSHGEFIILSDFEHGNPEVSKLRDIFESWEESELSDDEDENMEQLIKLAHEALALAIENTKVKSIFSDVFAENSELNSIPFNDLVKVQDPDGYFDINFLEAAN